MFCIGAFLLSHLAFILLPDIFVNLDRKVMDRLFIYKMNRDRIPSEYHGTVVHINLDNTSTKQLDSHVMDRSLCAKTIRNLSAMDVSSQVYDFIFPRKMKYQDNSLIVDATAGSDNVYFGLAFELDTPGKDGRHVAKWKPPDDNPREVKYINDTLWHPRVEGDAPDFKTGDAPLVTFVDLASVSRGLGFINLFSDTDGVFRRVPLLLRHKDGFYPSLPFLAVCDYLNVSPEKITIRPGDEIILHDAVLPRSADKTKNIHIPIDESGNMIINFTGPWEKMTHYHFIDILNADSQSDEILLWRNELAGKIALISEVSTASKDLGAVPMDSGYPLSGIHSNVILTILSGNFITELGRIQTLVIEALLLSLVILLSYKTTSPLSLSLASAGLLTLYFLFSAALFLYGNIVTNIVRPVIMVILSFAAVGLYRFFQEEKEKVVIRRTFETYFPPSVVKKVMGRSQTIRASGKKKEITILFSDIKDFTKLSSEMNPDDIKDLLNEYFEAMTDIVFTHGGTLDKFIGDGLMVFFGDPEYQSDHALRCVKAAMDMQKKTKMMNTKWEEEKGIPINIRIGINTGIAVVGDMGSSRRLSYTAIGANVNLAQRLESAAPVNGILISQKTYDHIKGHVPVKPMKTIYAKGYADPVASYEVIL